MDVGHDFAEGGFGGEKSGDSVYVVLFASAISQNNMDNTSDRLILVIIWDV